MSRCVFCAIVAGEAPAMIVDEDVDTVAFMDINPWERGHALVVPRRHYENLLEVGHDDLTNTFMAARRLARRMNERLHANGVALWNSCGAAAGQVVMHFHVHVVPVHDERPRPIAAAGRGDPADIAAAAAELRRT